MASLSISSPASLSSFQPLDSDWKTLEINQNPNLNYSLSLSLSLLQIPNCKTLISSNWFELMGRNDSATSLAPGFRFHPTDEELVRYYLKRKVLNKPFKFDPISVVDIYKSEPWDLPSKPISLSLSLMFGLKIESLLLLIFFFFWVNFLIGKSKLKSRDLEWYFFSALDKKYGNSSRTNRATEKGYWKTTGKDRPVRQNSRTVGMKKTLVYHNGRAPRGARSNWVMHEYRLVDEDLENSGLVLVRFLFWLSFLFLIFVFFLLEMFFFFFLFWYWNWFCLIFFYVGSSWLNW